MANAEKGGHFETETATRNGCSEIELAYAAGFFDGEGCISIGTRKNRLIEGRVQLSVQVTITQTGDVGRDVLVWFVGHFGGPLLGPFLRTQGHIISSRPYYVWQISYANARDFLTAVLPYLIRNRPVAENALVLLGRPKAGRRMSDDEYALRWSLYQRHRSLSQGHGATRPRVHVYDVDGPQEAAS